MTLPKNSAINLGMVTFKVRSFFQTNFLQSMAALLFLPECNSAKVNFQVEYPPFSTKPRGFRGTIHKINAQKTLLFLTALFSPIS